MTNDLGIFRRIILREKLVGVDYWSKSYWSILGWEKKTAAWASKTASLMTRETFSTSPFWELRITALWEGGTI